MNELDLQSALHVLVHPNMGLAVRLVKRPGAELIDIALAEDFSVSAGLVQKVHKIAVFKDILDLRGGKQVLNVLRNPRGDTAPFTKAFPNLHAPGTNLAAQQKVELVHEVPGGFSLIPVLGNTVPHLVLDHQHTQAFELLPQLLDIEADNGSNSWAYTRLGKMNIPEGDVTELLSNGDITLKIAIEK